jgi:molecular chaperone DnaK
MRQCDATKKAGELAGFAQCPLIMEPTAAAIAYGFQREVTKEYWLVYDFGGGTFDACLMKAEDGSIIIVNNGGDNYLGGSNIDWEIIDQLVIPELTANFNLPDFSRSNKRWRTALAVVKRAVEDAKIQLSRSDTAYLEGCSIKDGDGEVIEVDFKLTRDALVGVAEPIILRSVDICKRVLKEKNLEPSAIEKVILVGGPTLAPYFREILRERLGINLDHSVDPLTVVARGAAVFAGTMLVKSSGGVLPGQFAVDLKYPTSGPDLDPIVRGVVSSPSGVSLEGFVIELVLEKTHWRSGKVPLKADGRFKAHVQAEPKVRSEFLIELTDGTGQKQSVSPASFPYIHMTNEPPQPVLIRDIRIGLANNETNLFFAKGVSLPAKVSNRPFRTSSLWKKGDAGNVLRIPVVEGENTLVVRNVVLGSLDVKGTSIRRDVPAGQDVDVTLEVDASRIMRVKAYIPMLDEEFEAVIGFNKRSADPAKLEKEYDAVVQRLSDLRDKAQKAGDSRAEQLLESVTGLEEIERMISAGHGDSDPADAAERRLLEVQIILDEAEDALKWPALVAEANACLGELDKTLAAGTEDQKATGEKLREEVEELKEQKRSEPLRRRIEQARHLQWQIWDADPRFHVEMFLYLTTEVEKMTDEAKATRLVQQGRAFMDQKNIRGLRAVNGQLWALMPDDRPKPDKWRVWLGASDVGLLG